MDNEAWDAKESQEEGDRGVQKAGDVDGQGENEEANNAVEGTRAEGPRVRV